MTAAEKARDFPTIGFFNHAWEDPNALANLGTIPKKDMIELTDGLMPQDVPVSLNKMILDHDHLLICGPVFPHEVVGFSGGNKYFFPGIAGSEIINITHWIGALHTSYKIIGTKDTPVRRVIDRAASFIPKPRHAICTVVCHEGVNGVYVGTPEEAYSAAADLSAQTHIVWVDKPYRQALAVMPTLYDDLWTGAKGMYKLEPAMADGGEVIIYAPHITEISYTHGHHIRKVGYHVRDYFVKQMERFQDIPLSILAHSTHVRGIGTFENGVERPRVRVTLATKIPEAVCKQINLEYRDWRRSIRKSSRGKKRKGFSWSAGPEKIFIGSKTDNRTQIYAEKAETYLNILYLLSFLKFRFKKSLPSSLSGGSYSPISRKDPISSPLKRGIKGDLVAFKMLN